MRTAQAKPMAACLYRIRMSRLASWTRSSRYFQKSRKISPNAESPPLPAGFTGCRAASATGGSIGRGGASVIFAGSRLWVVIGGALALACNIVGRDVGAQAPTGAPRGRLRLQESCVRFPAAQRVPVLRCPYNRSTLADE